MNRAFRLTGLAFAAALAALPPSGVSAQGRETLGVGRVFNNDLIGDGRDRWRTGSYSISVLRGPAWGGALSTRPGDVVEYRFRGEIIGPEDLSNPAAGDRLFAGILSAGAHLHFDWVGFDVAAGLDLVAMGEQTGLRGLQASLHDLFSLPQTRVENYQVDDDVFLHATVELARDIRFSAGSLRPFVEVQTGVETLARAGVDLTLGGFGDGGLRLRDPVTGQRISGVNALSDTGWSLLLGADVAHLDRSALLPVDRGFVAEETRHRFRVGANYAVGTSNIFYGVTYLSEEFVGQPEGQLVGSLTLGLDF